MRTIVLAALVVCGVLAAQAADSNMRGATPASTPSVKEAEEAELHKEALRRIVKLWADDLGHDVNENFAYHGLMHNIWFAEAARQQAVLLRSSYTFAAFMGGLLHDSGYYMSVQENGYAPVCTREGKAWVFTPLAQKDAPRSRDVQNASGDHTKSNIGHEEYSVCWFLKLIDQIRKDSTPDEVTEFLKSYFTLEKTQATVAAIMHTKFQKVTDNTGALVWYTESEQVVADISALTDPNGSPTPVTMHFPNGLVCVDHEEASPTNVFPIGKMFSDEVDAAPEDESKKPILDDSEIKSTRLEKEDGEGDSEEANVTQEETTPGFTFTGDHDLNQMFENADFIQMAQGRSLCTSMSLLNEVMTYEGHSTFLPFPATEGNFNNVFKYIYQEDAGDQYRGPNGKYYNLNKLGPNVLAFLAGQDGFVKYAINYKAFGGESKVDGLIEKWIRQKGASVNGDNGSIFSNAFIDFIKCKYPNVDKSKFLVEYGKWSGEHDDRLVWSALCGSEDETEITKCKEKAKERNTCTDDVDVFRSVMAAHGCLFGNVPHVMVIGDSGPEDSVWTGRFFGTEDMPGQPPELSEIIPNEIEVMLSPTTESICIPPSSGSIGTSSVPTRSVLDPVEPTSSKATIKSIEDLNGGQTGMYGDQQEGRFDGQTFQEERRS